MHHVETYTCPYRYSCCLLGPFDAFDEVLIESRTCLRGMVSEAMRLLVQSPQHGGRLCWVMPSRLSGSKKWRLLDRLVVLWIMGPPQSSLLIILLLNRPLDAFSMVLIIESRNGVLVAPSEADAVLPKSSYACLPFAMQGVVFWWC